MSKRDKLIAATQESKILSTLKLNHKKDGYSIVVKDGSNKGGGLAFFIHDTVVYRTVDLQSNLNQPDQYLEQQTIVVSSGTTDITIVNIYMPPHSSCDSGLHAF